MRVRVSNKAGFCFGVQNAIDMVNNASQDDGGGISTLGPIIHNPQVVGKLNERGVKVISTLDEAETDRVFIRTHGVPPTVYGRASESGVELVDATCVIVKRAQETARQLHREGYTVVVIGKKNHPEVVGIVGYTDGTAHVVAGPDEIRQLKLRRRVGVVAQTTIRQELFAECVAELSRRTKELKVFNTLCFVVRKSLQATEELARTVDLMVIVGGKNSSNTKEHVAVCNSARCRALHVEYAQELEPWQFEGAEEVGVTAGTSTPHNVLQEVILRIKEIGDETPGKGVVTEATREVPQPDEQ